MYIRRTTIKSRRTGEPYYTYRLVESIREGEQVRQRTLLNLGRHFEVPRAQWGALVQRLERLLGGQADLVPADLDARWEEAAQRYAAQLIRTRASVDEGRSAEAADCQTVDIDTLELVRPRSVALEHVALAALRQVGLDRKLASLGLNGPQQAAAIATLVARMAAPGSELATCHWLQNHSAPTVVLDAGIATDENIAWLVENGYRYLVVSRKRHRQFDPDAAVLIKEEGVLRIQAQRRVDAETGEVELYCHSSARENKERAWPSFSPSASRPPWRSSPMACTRRGA